MKLVTHRYSHSDVRSKNFLCGLRDWAVFTLCPAQRGTHDVLGESRAQPSSALRQPPAADAILISCRRPPLWDAELVVAGAPNTTAPEQESKSRHVHRNKSCPLYPLKARTFVRASRSQHDGETCHRLCAGRLARHRSTFCFMPRPRFLPMVCLSLAKSGMVGTKPSSCSRRPMAAAK